MRPVPVIQAPRIAAQPFSAPFQNLQANPEAFGGGTVRHFQAASRASAQDGRVLQGIDRNLNIMFEREQKRQSDLEMLQAKKKLNDFELELSRPGGALTRKGEGASGSTKETQDKMAKLRSELLGRTSPGTKALVEGLFENRKRSLLGGVARNEQEQRAAVELALHEDGLSQEVDVYTGAPVDDNGKVTPEAQMRMETNVRSHLETVGKLNGIPKEITETRIKKTISAAHRARIERMIGNNESLKAKAYMLNNKDAMVESDQAAIEQHVNKSALGQQAQDAVDQVQGLSFKEQVNEINKIKDEGLRSSALSKLKINKNINDEIQADNNKNILIGAWGKQGQANASLTPTERSLMSGIAIQRWEEGHARVMAGLPLVTDQNKKTAFGFLTTEEKASMTESQFRNDWVPYLNESDRNSAESMLRRAREAKSPSTTVVSGIMSEDQIANGLIRRALGIKDKAKFSSLDATQVQIKREILGDIDRRIQAWEKANKRQAGTDTVREIVAEVELGRVFDKNRFSADAPLSTRDVTSDLLSDVIVPFKDISREMRENIVRSANTNGKALSEDEIEHVAGLRRVFLTMPDGSSMKRAAAAEVRRLTGAK